MRCYHCLHGHAVKLATLEQKGKSTELHGLCAGCMGKLEAAVFKMKEAIRRQDRDSLGEEVGRFRTYIRKSVV